MSDTERRIRELVGDEAFEEAAAEQEVSDARRIRMLHASLRAVINAYNDLKRRYEEEAAAAAAAAAAATTAAATTTATTTAKCHHHHHTSGGRP